MIHLPTLPKPAICFSVLKFMAIRDGTYYMFDFNPKPNLTGAARPHRMNQNCLTMISAAAQGWSYFDLLHKMSESRRQL